MIKSKKLHLLVPLFITVISINLFSCKNSTESKLAYADVDTVKETIKKMETEIAWTKELESTRLSEEIDPGVSLADENIQVSPDLVKIIKDYNEPVYPELLDFGLLDSSSLSYSAKEKINDFCESLNVDIYAGPESYFAGSYGFNYIFFKNDFINGWETNFEEDYPLTEELAKENREKRQKNRQIEEAAKQKELAEQKEKERLERIEKGEATEEDYLEVEKKDKEVESKNKKEEIKEEPEPEMETFDEVYLFEKWVFGQPFIGPEIIQVPVRFYCKQGTVDVTLYINQTKQNSIYQITIDRWGKA